MIILASFLIIYTLMGTSSLTTIEIYKIETKFACIMPTPKVNLSYILQSIPTFFSYLNTLNLSGL